MANKVKRPPCCDKSNVKRGLWTAEEDAKLLAYVSAHGTGNWTLVPKKAGLNRCGKSCRLRWTNYLRPDLKHDNFSSKEEDLIINFHEAIGSRWSLIAKQLPGRTDNDVKNYWNTKLRKKLLKMGIDPITHKPFSQVFSDVENISGHRSTRNNQICVSTGETLNAAPAPTSPSSLFITHLGSSSMINVAMTPFIMEQVHQNFTSERENYHSSQHQYQVMNQETVQPQDVLNEITSSCSSSSTTLTQLTSSQSCSPLTHFTWTGSSLYQPFHPDFAMQTGEGDLHDILAAPMNRLSTTMQKHASTDEITNENEDEWDKSGDFHHEGMPKGQGSECQFEDVSCCFDSFVDAILEKDRKMRWELFPGFTDGFLDY